MFQVHGVGLTSPTRLDPLVEPRELQLPWREVGVRGD
jgi:hypothetical protein